MQMNQLLFDNWTVCKSEKRNFPEGDIAKDLAIIGVTEKHLACISTLPAETT